MDEASAFKSANGNTDNADACYQVLRTSANSRFPMLRWVGMIISFPRKQVGDFTYDKYEQAIRNPKYYGDTGSTWEINPKFDPTHPFYEKDMEWVVLDEVNLRVPEPYADEFTSDPISAKTKYLCQPPPIESGFFDIPKKVFEAVNAELPPLTYTRNVVERMVPKRNHRTGEVTDYPMRYVANEIDAIPPRVEDCEYFMHGDPGLVNDAFALCVCHTLPESRWLVDQDGNEREVRKVVVDFVLAWEPTSETPVDLSNIDATILAFARYYGIRRVTFDKWNSANSIQMLIREGIYAEDMSFSLGEQLKIYRNLKMLFYNSLIEIPDDEALTKELVYLKNNNGKIEHDAFGKDRAGSARLRTDLPPVMHIEIRPRRKGTGKVPGVGDYNEGCVLLRLSEASSNGMPR